MKEHPIIFSTEMVKAILDGRKTQTRRVIKSQPPRHWDAVKPIGWTWCFYKLDDPDFHGYVKRPYGQVGDWLWVRETHTYICNPDSESDDGVVLYKASANEVQRGIYKWRPSIFMPRWASRITLEIVNIRIERLQEISEEDAKAEGIAVGRTGRYLPGNCDYATWAFHILWDSINAKRGYGWDSNPWVWVIEFEEVT